MTWHGLGEFAIEHGRRITVRRLEGASWSEFRDLVLTNIAGFALLEQGVETLHSSGVEINGQAVAFAGRAGSAKSTLAALFFRRGCRVLTDDLLPLHVAGERVQAYPSIGEIKLMPEAARALRVHPSQLFPMTPPFRKFIWKVRAAEGPRPLAAIYFPSISMKSRRVILRPLTRREAFHHLLAYNFNAVLITRRRMRRLLALCTRIAEEVPARRLLVPRNWKKLDTVAARIEADLKSLRR